MQLLVTILKNYQQVEALLLTMVELDINGSTVIEASGMGGILSKVPIMSGVAKNFPQASKPSHVILTVTDSNKVHQCIEQARRTLKIGMEQGAGIMFTVPLEQWIGISGNTPSIKTGLLTQVQK